MAKRSDMTILQILQYLVSSLYFFKLYDEQIENVKADVFAKDIAIIEASLNEFKDNKSDDLSDVTQRYLTKFQQLKFRDQISNEEFKSLRQEIMVAWERDLRPYLKLPAQINIQDHGTINLTIDFIMISMLTGFSFEQALQVYIDSYIAKIVP